MKFKRDDLLTQLSVLKPAIAAGGVIMELRHIWFDKHYAKAYDGGLGIRIPLKLGCECGVAGAVLLGLLGTSPLKEVEVELADKKALQVKIGSSTSKISALMDGNVWPFPEKTPDRTDLTELTEDFVEALRKALFVKPSQRSAIEHQGVVVESGKKTTMLYTTDSKTIARVCVAGKDLFPERTLLPREFCEQVVERCAKGASLLVGDHYMAAADDITIYCNMLDSSGVRDLGALVEKFIKKQPPPVDLPAGMEAALNRAVVLAGSEDPFVELHVKKGDLSMKGKFAFGALDEEFDMEGKHPDATIKIAAPHLRRGLAQADKFSFNDDTLVMYGENDFVYLIAGV